MNGYGIAQKPESYKLAKELTSIATNIEFGSLRNEMVESRLIDEVSKVGGEQHEIMNFIGLLLGTLVNVMVTVEVLADDIADHAPVATEPKTLRRSPDVDDQFRERDV